MCIYHRVDVGLMPLKQHIDSRLMHFHSLILTKPAKYNRIIRIIIQRRISPYTTSIAISLDTNTLTHTLDGIGTVESLY